MVLSHLWYYPPYFFCKVNANERNESLLSNCRVQLNFCKVNANERNGKEILSFYLLRYMISIIFYLSSVLVRSRFYDFAPSSSRARSHLRPSFIYQKWGSEQAIHPSLPHSLYIKSGIKIILYISLPRIKIFLYIFIPRAKNCHHSIYFLGTKVSQVWSS